MPTRAEKNSAPASLTLWRWLLSRPRWQRVWGIALILYSVILCGVRLFNLLAFEFAFACTIPLSFLGAYSALKVNIESRSPWAQWRAALKPALFLGLLPLIPISINALRVRNCNWLDGVIFYALLSLMSVVIACGWGLLIKFVSARRGQSALTHPDHQDASLSEIEPKVRQSLFIFGMIFLGAVLWGLFAFFMTPSVDVFSTFIGYYPGALYDEEMIIGPRLALSRLEDFMVITLALAWVSDVVPRRSRMIITGSLVVVHLWGWSLDLHRPAWWVQRQLGGARSTAHYKVYYPQSWSTERVDQLTTELEFNYLELTEFFQRAPQRPVEVYFYRDTRHKKRLMGAGRTLIAKPWQYGIHVHTPSVGDRVITHELAHVFSAEIAPAPHHLSLWRGILPNMSLIEGLAVAAAWTRGRGSGLMSRLTPDQWTAALRQLDLAPPVDDLFNPKSFYAYNSRISYTICGSFVRFYRRTRGADALNALYASGGDAADLSAAINAWETWLDQRQLSSRLLNTASSILGGASIFYKVCAHELAARRNEALDAELNREYTRALELWRSVEADKPRDAQALLRRISILVDMNQLDEAQELVSDALKAQQESPVFHYMNELRLREWSVDIAWFLETRALDETYRDYERLLSLGMDRPRWRRLAVKRYALSPHTSAELGRVIAELFRKQYTGEERDAALSNALERWPQSAELHYLKARLVLVSDTPEEAEPLLRQSLSLGLSHPALTYEALRVQASLDFKQKRYDEAEASFTKLARREDLLIEEGERHELELWARRAAFFDQNSISIE